MKAGMIETTRGRGIAVALLLAALPWTALAETPAPIQKIQELTRPVPSSEVAGSEAGPKPTVAGQLIRHANPATFGTAVKDGYTNREFLSTHGTVHSNPGDAMLRSIAPVEGAANTRAAVKGSLDPANIAISFGLPVAQEAVRQFVHNGHVDPSKLGQQINVPALTGSFVGGMAGTVAGAVLQSALASSLGPFGTVAGFVAKPMLGWVGGMIGANFGNNATHGNLSLGQAYRQSLASVRPGRDIGSVLGGTVGMVIGQALIPIPGVGGFVGSLAGTMIGGWLGSKLMHEGGQTNPTSLIGTGLRGLTGKSAKPSQGGFNPVGGLSSTAP